MQTTAVLLRKRTAWRELLHPLPSTHRKLQWLRRDKVEMNEFVLRKPYYTLVRSSTSNDRLRESLVLPAAIGPNFGVISPHSMGAPLPRYPTGYETVAPQSPRKD